MIDVTRTLLTTSKLDKNYLLDNQVSYENIPPNNSIPWQLKRVQLKLHKLNLDMLITSFLRPAVPLTQDKADALQKLLEGAQVNIGHPIVAGITTLEEVQQLLTQRGLDYMAGNLRTELSQSKHPIDG